MTRAEPELDVDDEQDLDEPRESWDEDAGDCADCGSPITSEDCFTVDGFDLCERCAWSVVANGGRLL